MSEGARFDRPVGPHADVCELEYISALHQTCTPNLRQNGTIKATDIVHYLASRHAIRIEEDYVKEKVIEELCGSYETDFMDLCQLLTLLLIPYFRSYQEEKLNVGKSNETNVADADNPYLENTEEEQEQIKIVELDPIHKVFQLFFQEAKNVGEANGNFKEHKGGFNLSIKFLQQILESYGEYGIPPQVMKEMIVAAGGDSARGIFMNERSFVKALTSDVQDYLPLFNKKVRTNFNDAMHGDRKKDAVSADDEIDEENEYTAEKEGAMIITEKPWKRFYSAPSIDFAADNYRSVIWIVCIWELVVLTYVFYASHVKSDIDVTCTEDQHGCTIGKGVLTWIDVFIDLTIYGLPFVYFCGLGNIVSPLNTIGKKAKLTIALLFGLLFTFWASFMPFRYEYINGILNTEKEELFKAGYWLAFLSGVTIMVLQVLRLITVWVPFNKILNKITGGTIGLEYRTKKAATSKINLMVENALMMHYPIIRKTTTNPNVSPAMLIKDDDGDDEEDGEKTNKTSADIMAKRNMSSTKPLSSSKAFAQYLSVQGISEFSGGISWFWKRIFNGSLFTHEGIWFHSRTLTCNTNQFLIAIVFLVCFVMVIRMFDQLVEYLMQPLHDPFMENIAREYAAETVDGKQILVEVNRSITEASIAVSTVYAYFYGNLINSTNTSMFDRLFDIGANQLVNTAGEIYEQSIMKDDTNWTEVIDNTIGAVEDFTSGNSTGNTTDVLLAKFEDLVEDFIIDVLNETLGENATALMTSTDEVIGNVTEAFNQSMRLLDEDAVIYYDASDLKLVSTITSLVPLGPATLQILAHMGMDDSLALFFNARDGSFFVSATYYLGFYNSSTGNYTAVLTDGAFLYDNTTGKFVFDDDYYYVDEFLGGFIHIWEVKVAISAGFFLALFATMGNALIFLPSTSSTLIKFRTGYFGSLHNPIFKMYRSSPDAATVLIGTTFWGTFVTGSFAWFFTSLFFFFLVWHLARTFVFHIFASLVGLLLTNVIKIVSMTLIRSSFYAGMYRKKPAASNFVTLALECWNLALTAGIMVVRTAIFLVITSVYLGRVDQPMLAPGVGYIGPVCLDSAPIAFKKDILIQEAHRHPYIERLGLMYLMKLRHGDKFGTRAGACWRLVFVLALFPWLRPRRVVEIDHDDEIQGDDEERPKLASVQSNALRNLSKASIRGGLGNMQDSASLQLEVNMLRQEIKRLNIELGKRDKKSHYISSSIPEEPAEEQAKKPVQEPVDEMMELACRLAESKQGLADEELPTRPQTTRECSYAVLSGDQYAI